MLINYILIIGIVVVGLAGLVFYIRSLDKNTESYELDQDLDIDLKYLVNEVSLAFARTTKKSFNEDNLSKEALERKKERMSIFREAMREAGQGNPNAKKIVKNYIEELLHNEKYEINESNINRILPFDKPDQLKAADKFNLLLFLYEREYGIKGLDVMIQEYKLTRPIENDNDELVQKITKEVISLVYEDVIVNKGSNALKNIELDFNEKIKYLSQKIYERYLGFGCIDSLYEMAIDEISGGVSGIPKSNISGANKNDSYSYESVWIIYHGMNIQLECLSFETEDELIRVCSNVYKYETTHVLSRLEGKVQGTMYNGDRVVVTRPPFTESFSFIIRKFNTSPSVKPSDLNHDTNSILAINLVRWLIKGQQNIPITGSQGSGKSTALKSFVRFIDHGLNIRINEKQAEANLRYSYPDRQIITFQETSTIDAQSSLDFQKKTSGDVTIIQEVASAIQASHLIQSALVASLFTMFTHHAKQAKDLIEALSNNLLELGLYKEKRDAVSMVLKVIHLDIHFTKEKGNRHIERITEIIPITEDTYPSTKETTQLEDKLLQNQLNTFMDAPVYFKKITDPKLFETKDLVRWYPNLTHDNQEVLNSEGEITGYFKIENMPSKELMNDILAKLSPSEGMEFKKDLDMMKRISDGEQVEGMTEWINNHTF